MKIIQGAYMYVKYTLIIFIISLVSGCIAKSKIQIRLMSGKQQSAPLSFSVANVQVINHQIIITGSNLNSVTDFQIKEGATTTDLEIESVSNTSIIANSLSNVSFAAGRVFDFVLSNADAASTFTVNFSLCDSTLGGKGFNCLLTPNDKDVLSYDALSDKWIPRNVNGLNYKATFDASPGVDPGGSPLAGDYYIISVGGTINSVSYAVGDWIVYNADDLEWQKVSNTKDVLSVFGRTGKISAKKGDYNLGKMSDVEILVVPTIDQILKFNGTNWVPATLAAPAAAAGTAGAPGFSFSGNANTGFFRPAANQIGITNNGVESVRIDNLGHMGIGTPAPNTALTIKSSNYTPAFPVTMDVIDNSTLAQDIGGGIGFGATDGTGDKWYGSIRGGKSNAISGNYDGYLSLSTSVNGTDGMTERMRITSAGNVGIGTSAPISQLHILSSSGNSKLIQDTFVSGVPYFVGRNAGGTSATPVNTVSGNTLASFGGIGHDGTSYSLFPNADISIISAQPFSGAAKGTYMAFSTTTNGTTSSLERMRITDSGKVGIGTATPGSTLDIKGTLRLSGATSGYVGFSPPAVAGTTTYTLPSAPGTNGQVLTTNAANVLSWTSIGGVPAGTSGGIPYYDSATTTASSGVLTLYGLLIGGGAGGAPSSLGVGVSGQFLKSAGVATPSFANINLTDLKSTVSGNLFPGVGCAAGETLVYGTVIDAFSCVTGNVIVGTQTNRTTDSTNRGQLAQSSTYTQTVNADLTLNWNNGNLQEINTFVCNGDHTITFSNTKDGAAYSLLLSGAAAHTGVCVFSAPGYNFNTSGGALAPVTGKNVLFTFAVIGGTIVYSMMDDLQ